MNRYSHVKVDRIPFARLELLDLADELGLDGLGEYSYRIRQIVQGLMHRKFVKPYTARPRQAPFNRQKVLDIQEDVRRNPKVHNRIIGRRHGVDGGRVSEVIRGLRTPDDPTMSRFKHVRGGKHG